MSDVKWVPIKAGDTLQSQARTGKAKFWYAFIGLHQGEYAIIKEWWLEGGAHQRSTPKIVKPKNVGKANETQPLEQAKTELASIYVKQRNKGYSLDGSTDHIPTKPMLAHKWLHRSHGIVFPCRTQPKFDGVRMLMDGTRAWTRGAKDYIPEVVAHLMFDTGGLTLDGELKLYDNVELQMTSRAYKKISAENAKLHYFVYDLVSDASFRDRYAQLEALFATGDVPDNVVLVHCRHAQTEDDIYAHHKLNVADGYEGTMIRNALGGYEAGHRSPNLLKLKDLQDKEFKVIDIREGEGSFTGKAKLVCVIEDSGETFTCVPKGTDEVRRYIFRNKDQFIGRWITVQFQDYSERGIPQKPIGIEFRDEDEF